MDNYRKPDLQKIKDKLDAKGIVSLNKQERFLLSSLIQHQFDDWEKQQTGPVEKPGELKAPNDKVLEQFCMELFAWLSNPDYIPGETYTPTMDLNEAQALFDALSVKKESGTPSLDEIPKDQLPYILQRGIPCKDHNWKGRSGGYKGEYWKELWSFIDRAIRSQASGTPEEGSTTTGEVQETVSPLNHQLIDTSKCYLGTIEKIVDGSEVHEKVIVDLCGDLCEEDLDDLIGQGVYFTADLKHRWDRLPYGQVSINAMADMLHVLNTRVRDLELSIERPAMLSTKQFINSAEMNFYLSNTEEDSFLIRLYEALKEDLT